MKTFTKKFRHLLICRLVLLFAISFCFSINLIAQNYNYFTIPNVANGTSGSGRGPINTQLNQRSITIYRASEILPYINPGDTISKVGWVISTAGSSVSGNMRIYMINTTDTTNTRTPPLISTAWTTAIASLPQKYYGSMTIPAATGAYTIKLDTDFVYTGGGIYLAYEWVASSTGTGCVYYCNTSLTTSQANAQGATMPTNVTASSNFRAQVVLGVKPKQVDASVDEIYSLGKLPIPYALPHFVRAKITNKGSDTLTSYPVTLSITGANSFVDVQYINLNPGISDYVTFSGFNPTSIGLDSVSVTVPNDDNNSNNYRLFNQNINYNTYSYADPTKPAIGGVGFNGVTGDFVAKFPYVGANAVNQIGVNFNTGGVNLQVAIWDTTGSGGTPGTMLWTSSSFTTSAGTNTIPVNPPVAISGSFYVGVRQIGTTNAAFSYQNENPIRNQTFYYTTPTGSTSWVDFASGNNPFRFMIEPRLQLANDVGITTKLVPCPAVVQNSDSFYPSARIYNYGTLSQSSPFYVKYQITGPINYIDSQQVTVLSGSSSDIVFTNSFNPTTPGTYTVKIFPELSTDGDRNNDTLTSFFIVNGLNYGNSAVNKLQFDGIDDYLDIPLPNKFNSSSQLTIEAWVNTPSFSSNRTIFSRDTSKTGTGRHYTLYINTSGKLVFVMRSSLYLDSIVSSQAITAGTNTHVAAIFDPLTASLKLYINGDTAGTKVMSGSMISSTFPITIGKFQQPSSDYFYGTIDEIKIWDAARTESQIRAGMHTRLPNLTNLDLILYLRLDEGVGSTIVTDASGECNSASLNNMDYNNNTATPAWVSSLIPIGTPVVNAQSISMSGPVTFTGTNLTMNFYNFSGSQDYVVHYFNNLPLGTSPTVNPGGVSNVHNRYWLIYNYGSATFDSVIPKFSFVGGSPLLPAVTKSDVILFKRGNGENGNWIKHDSAFAVNPSLNYAEFLFGSNTKFVNQFVAGGNNGSLPVKLISFTGVKLNSDIQLQWKTANEKNNAYFIIEKSTDNKNFIEIGKVYGKNNSNEITTYKYSDIDGAISVSDNIYYRLKQVDIDGMITLSNTVSFYINNALNIETSIVPNPFIENVSLNINATNYTLATIKVLSINGQLIFEKIIEVQSGNNNIELNEMKSLTDGFYFMNINVGGKTINHKLIKVKN